MNLPRISITIAVTFLISYCTPNINQFPDIKHQKYAAISFCDLPNYEEDTVYVRGIYSGYEEYWSFNPIEKKCRKDFNVYFDLLSTSNKWSSEVDAKLKFIHTNYTEGFLILDVIGVFESGEQFGHLGSNSSRFIVQEIVKAKLIDE